MLSHRLVGEGVQALVGDGARRGRERLEGCTAGRGLVYPAQDRAAIQRAQQIDDALQFGADPAVGSGEDLAHAPIARASRAHSAAIQAGDDPAALAGLLGAGVFAPAGLAQAPRAGDKRGDPVGLAAAVARRGRLAACRAERSSVRGAVVDPAHLAAAHAHRPVPGLGRARLAARRRRRREPARPPSPAGRAQGVGVGAAGRAQPATAVGAPAAQAHLSAAIATLMVQRVLLPAGAAYLAAEGVTSAYRPVPVAVCASGRPALRPAVRAAAHALAGADQIGAGVAPRTPRHDDVARTAIDKDSRQCGDRLRAVCARARQKVRAV